MQRNLIWLVLVAAGALAGYLFGAQRAPSPASAPMPVLRDAPPAPPLEVHTPEPKLSAEQVQNHRQDNYREMTSMDDILELPNDFTQTEALYTLAGRADEQTLHTFIGQSIGIANRYDRRAALQILYQRYGELDPNAAVDHLLSLNLDIDTQIIGSIFESWAKEDVNGAIAAANAIANVGRRRRAGHAVLQAYAQIDPGMLEEVARRLDGSYDTVHYEAQVIGTTANHSPSLALDQALALSSQNARYRAVHSVAQVWARTDPHGAFTHAATIANENQRNMFLEAVISRWVTDDPVTAIDAAFSLQDAQQQESLASNAIFHLAGQDPEQAYAMADRLQGNARANAQQQVIDRWMQSDPDAALAAVMEQPDSPYKGQLLAMAGRRYAERDPRAALAWASQLPDGQRNTVYMRMLNQVARDNPQEALNIAINTEGPQRSRMIQTAIRSASQQRPDLAATYVDRIPAGDLRRQAIAQVASNWASRDTDAALNWISGLDDKSYAEAIAQISYQVAQRDPDGAAAYVNRIRPDARASWITSVANVYARTDPQRAISFARRFVNDPLYDTAMTAAISQMGYSDPTGALRLAEGLNTQSREQATMQVVTQWASNDPAAAARWADTQPAGSSNASLMHNIASQWANHDPQAAMGWTMGRPQGAARDSMIQALLGTGTQSVSDSVRLIDALADNTRREQAIFSAYIQLLHGRNDPGQAAALLDRTGLTPEQRQRLESMMTNMGRR